MTDPLIIQEKNQLASKNAWLVLLKIQFVQPELEDVRLVNNTEDIVFDGETYTRFAFELDVETVATTGEIQALMLRVSNIGMVLIPFLQESDGCVDTIVTIMYVNTGLLSGVSFAEFTIEYEVVSVEIDSEWVSFTLGAPNPIRRRFPLDRYLPRQCQYVRQFKGVECKYAGADPTCTGGYNDCLGKGNTPNFGGFIGMDDMKLRLA